MKLTKAVAFVLALGVAGLASAHSDEYLDTVQAPHGGQLRMAGVYHYELVIKPAGKDGINDVLVYLTDHAGKPVDTKGASGTATILSNAKASVALAPEGKNLMKGTGNFGLTPNLKAVVSIALPGQPAEQARFMPMGAQHANAGMQH